MPFKFLVDKFAHVRFETSGWTGNSQIPYAKSIMDYIFRWMGAKFLCPEYAVTEAGETMTLRPTETSPQQELPFNAMTTDAPLCSECGSIKRQRSVPRSPIRKSRYPSRQRPAMRRSAPNAGPS